MVATGWSNPEKKELHKVVVFGENPLENSKSGKTRLHPFLFHEHGQRILILYWTSTSHLHCCSKLSLLCLLPSSLTKGEEGTGERKGRRS